jgi:hypothetical protein
MKTIVQPIRKIHPDQEVPVYHLPCRKHDCQALLEISKDELEYDSINLWSFFCPHCGTQTQYDGMLLSTFKVTPKKAGFPIV